jgi:hypothetical protein
LCAHTSPWLRNSMRMTKCGVPVGSTKTLVTQLKVTTLVSDIVCTVPQDNNSRSGAPPLSLHHSSQKVNLSAKTKIKKEKRKVKNLITRTRTQISPPPSQKRCHWCRFPPPLQGAPRECRSSSIFSVPDNRTVTHSNV